MTDKIQNHLHYLEMNSLRVYATFQEALEQAEFEVQFRKLKKQPYDYVKICFIHSLKD